VDGTGENKRPAVLPFAPVAVLGVVAVRGRMLTAVDPVALITGEPFEWRSELPWLIALRGDEQLALAAEDLGETVTIAMSDVESAGSSQTNDVVTGISRHAGHEITILKSSSLFAAAVQRRERRRRRF
jgi:chemotaxis signal transduction protein